MTVEEIVALDKTPSERARMIREQNPELGVTAIARMLGCPKSTVRSAFVTPEQRRAKKARYTARPVARVMGVTKVTVEQRDGGWCVCLNGKERNWYATRDLAEDEAEWLRWPKTEKGKAA